MMHAFAAARVTGNIVEYQRLDLHWHCVGRQPRVLSGLSVRFLLRNHV